MAKKLVGKAGISEEVLNLWSEYPEARGQLVHAWLRRKSGQKPETAGKPVTPDSSRHRTTHKP
ncbi:MAG: hypothetical protein ABI353_04480 [Isosphaeraceae bacterium]